MICAGEITSRRREKWNVYTCTDHGGYNKYIQNLYRNLLCSHTLGEQEGNMYLGAYDGDIAIKSLLRWHSLIF